MLSKVLEDSYENPETKNFSRTTLIDTKLKNLLPIKKQETTKKKHDTIKIETLTRQEALDVYFDYCIGIGDLPTRQLRTCIKLKKHISKIKAERLKNYE